MSPAINKSSQKLRILEWAIFPFLFITALVYQDYQHEKSTPRRIINADQEGYYMYLPSVFIYDGFTGYHLKNCCRRKEESGEWISKYTYGVALLQSPFFLGAHLVSKVSEEAQYLRDKPKGIKAVDWEVAGFTKIYAKGILFAGAFYACMGLLLLYFVLKRLTNPFVSLFTVFCIFFGTNFFHYTIDEAGMSHVYSFFLFALAIWLLPRFLENPTFKNALLLGIPLGLILLIRPTNIVFILVVFLWEVYNLQDLKKRFRLLLKNIGPTASLALPFALLLIPQMWYWNHMNGHLIFYSYAEQGFDNWNSPYLWSVLFSYQNGLFAYTPLMLLIFPGLVLSFRKKQNSPILAITLFVIPLYIFASWWAWWFGGAFGHRSFIEFYVLFSLPFAMTIKWLSQKHKAIQVLALSLVVWMWIGNIKLTLQYQPPWDGEYWNVQRYQKEMRRAYLF